MVCVRTTFEAALQCCEKIVYELDLVLLKTMGGVKACLRLYSNAYMLQAIKNWSCHNILGLRMF